MDKSPDTMHNQHHYSEMVSSGADSGQVYLAARSDGLDWVKAIRLIREIFGLSLVEAKEVAVVADGLAGSLSEHQERLIPALEAAFEEVEREEQDSQ